MYIRCIHTTQAVKEMTNFKSWLEDADMPTKVNGQWVDLETGHPYQPAYAARSTYTPSSSVAEHRKYAKQFGGKALTGTPKQKEWAEKIRAEKLSEMSKDQAEMACDPSGMLKSSKAWIENRHRTGEEIGDFAMKQKTLHKQFLSMQKKRSEAVHVKDFSASEEITKEMEVVAAEYNALIESYGFE